MKKNKLIELLNKIEGNPDIVLWNGFVSDYQDISSDMVEDYLTKDTLQLYLDRVEAQRAIRLQDSDYKLSEEEIAELTTNYKRIMRWELNQYITEEDFKSKMYRKKRVVFIQPKLRGVSTWDRLGTINY